MNEQYINTLKYIKASTWALKHGMWPEVIAEFCRDGKIEGCRKSHGIWFVPRTTDPKAVWRMEHGYADPTQFPEEGRAVKTFKDLVEKALSSKERGKLSKGEFVYPKERKYPINDIAHGRNALARVSAHGTRAEKAKVRKAVYSKFPSLKKDKKK